MEGGLIEILVLKALLSVSLSTYLLVVVPQKTVLCMCPWLLSLPLAGGGGGGGGGGTIYVKISVLSYSELSKMSTFGTNSSGVREGLKTVGPIFLPDNNRQANTPCPWLKLPNVSIFCA